jgi:hypothetical protein
LCGATVNYSVPLFSDNCAGTNQTGIRLAGPPSGNFFPVGTTNIRYFFSDPSGNSVDTIFSVTVEDNEAPFISTPASDLTVDCDGTGNIADFNVWLSGNGNAVASENCATLTWSNDYNPENWINGCGITRNVTVTFRAEDDEGNFSTTAATFTIEDTQAPVWTTDADALNTTVQCSDIIAITAAQNLKPVASDDCDGDVSNINKTSGPFVPGLCSQAGSYTNTWTVTDDCGNTSEVFTQVITV